MRRCVQNLPGALVLLLELACLQVLTPGVKFSCLTLSGQGFASHFQDLVFLGSDPKIRLQECS